MSTTELDPADFPLTPLDVMPLHPDAHLGPNGWYGCEDDDRAPTPTLRYDWRCPACVTRARAEVDRVGDWVAGWQYGPDDHPRQVSMSWMLRRADHWAAT